MWLVPWCATVEDSIFSVSVVSRALDDLTECFIAIWNPYSDCLKAFLDSTASVIVWKWCTRFPLRLFATWQLSINPRLTGGNGSDVHEALFQAAWIEFSGKRSRLGLQAWEYGEDEVPKWRVLSDEEAWWMCVCMLQRRTQTAKVFVTATEWEYSADHIHHWM